MKQMTHQLKIFLLALWLLADCCIAQAQIVNSGFDQNTPGGGGCPSAVWGWVEGPVPGSIQWEVNYDNGNWWLDITGCGWGNGRWIEQATPTIPGQNYRLTFDLGCWNGQYHTDAGAILHINGVSQGRFAHTNFSGSATAPLTWKKFEYCFTATTTMTTIRFTADGLPTYASPPGTTTADVGVIGLDNVRLQKSNNVDSLFKLTYTRSGCTYCFKLVNPFVDGPNKPYASNIKWYVDNVLKQNGDTLFCITLPPAPSAEVMVIYTVNSVCGNAIDTIKQVVTAEPTIINAGTITLNTLCGQGAATYTPNCGSPYTNYELRTSGGTLVSSGTSPAGPIPLTPGNYVFTCIYTSTCTTMHRKTNIIVYPASMTTVYGPPTVIDVCGQNTADFTPDCTAPYSRYDLTGPGYSSSGPLSPAPVLTLGPATYTLVCYDDVNCIKRVSTVTINVTSTLKESFCTLNLRDCNELNDKDIVAAALAAACPDCWEVVVNATAVGPLVPVSYDAVNQTQTVTCEYIDQTHCRKCTVTFIVPLKETRCEIKVECKDLLKDAYETKIGELCPDCKETIANATWIGPLQTGYYDYSRGCQVMTREYIDFKNCTKCTVTILVPIKETVCTVKLDDCKQIYDEGFIARVMEQCPDCGRTILEATRIEELNPYYDRDRNMLIITREYFDFVNCTKCTIRIEIQNFNVPVITVNTMEPCVTIAKDQLLPCLAEAKFVNVIPYTGEPYPGDQTTPVTFVQGQEIRLCCNDRDPAYYLYSKEDPCCAMIIRLRCNTQPGTDLTGGKAEKAGQLLSEFRLVPNPTAAVFRIMSAGKSQEQYKQVDVVDMNGKVVLTRTAIDDQTMIDMSKYNEGIYGVKVITSEGKVVILKLTLVKN